MSQLNWTISISDQRLNTLQRCADGSCGTGHGARHPTSPLAFPARALWVQHSVSQSPECEAECGLCRNLLMWPVQENVPFLSLFKAKQELLFKESCSQTPVWWLIAEIPANLQPAIAEGPTRWACSFLLPQSLRIPDF